MMRASLLELEKAIQEEPGQWLWSHNRWKQQTPGKLQKRFRYESILVILPQEKETITPLLSQLGVFREVYPTEFLVFYVPKGFENRLLVKDAEIVPCSTEEELLKRDFRFKLVFNFSTSHRVKPHFKKLAAFEVVSLEELYHTRSKTWINSKFLTECGIGAADQKAPFAETFKRAVLRSYAP